MTVTILYNACTETGEKEKKRKVKGRWRYLQISDVYDHRLLDCLKLSQRNVSCVIKVNNECNKNLS
jgi:hypothetical protein